MNDRVFEPLPGGGYAFKCDGDGVRVEFRHLRREHFQLCAEVDVQCHWADARRLAGSDTISCADLNLSSQSARQSRAKYCRERSHPGDPFDWSGLLDEACQAVIGAERKGAEVMVLDDAPDDTPQDFVVHGITIPSDSHSLLVCDGDGLKSLTLLLVLGEMAKRGIPVGYLDWEWNGPRHKQRKLRLFGSARLETLFYRRGRHSLTGEIDDIRKFCDERRLAFIGIDSIGAACEGKLADDDVARAYNRCLDLLPPSLAAAHIPKATDPEAPAKPFGSVFFSNYTRMSWRLQKQLGASKNLVRVLYTPGKQNDGRRASPVALEYDFGPEQIQVRHLGTSLADSFTLPLHFRLQQLMTNGDLKIAEMATKLNALPDSVEKALKRHKETFWCHPGPDGIDRWGLLQGKTQ